MLLTESNYSKGFLVDDETIAGVTKMGEADAEPVFAAYVSHYLTGETLEYREFAQAAEALAFLDSIKRPWIYEAIGCGPHSQKTTSGCGTGGCGTGGCGTC